MTSLVTVAQVKAHLNFPDSDITHDDEIQTFIDGCQPVIENITGPIVQNTYTEFYDGGQASVLLRHRPIVSVTSVTEYRGSIAYTLTQVANASLGTPWSYTFEPTGRIVRRGIGGGEMAFPSGLAKVQVVYVAGQASTPANVTLAMLELVRHNWQLTQQGGRPSFPSSYGADDSPYVPSGFAVPTRVLELLAPNRRGPSVA
jgi:hypothetical protein